MKLVVLGAGPTGISVIHELLLNGISPAAITIVDSRDTIFKSKLTRTTETNSNSILGTVLRERQNQGLGKNGKSLSDDQSLIQSPSSHWGGIVLPSAWLGNRIRLFLSR